MELQEFSPQHLYSQLAFRESQVSVIDRRGATGKAMSDHLGLSDVTLHPTAAEVISPDERNNFRIGIAQTFVGLSNFSDLADAREQSGSFFKMALEYLGNPTIASGQVRTYDIAPVDSFTDLRDRLMDTLAAGSKGLGDAMGIRMKDVGWVLEFEESEVAAKVQLGAMESEQLQGILKDPDGTGYPPALLFIALETAFNAGEQGAADGLDWWSHCVDRNRKMSEKISMWFTDVLG